jgi:hypothetical protein
VYECSASIEVRYTCLFSRKAMVCTATVTSVQEKNSVGNVNGCNSEAVFGVVSMPEARCRVTHRFMVREFATFDLLYGPWDRTHFGRNASFGNIWMACNFGIFHLLCGPLCYTYFVSCNPAQLFPHATSYFGLVKCISCRGHPPLQGVP